MFIRTKKIKKFEYAYKVKNKWTKNGTRQKIVGYLGRIHKPEKTRDVSFDDFTKKKNISKTSFREIIDYLIKWELHKHGFNENNGKFKQKKLVLDVKDGITSRKRDVVLGINEGFLCSETIKKILNFKPEDDEEDTGFKLANVFVDAGVKIPNNVFIILFERKFKSF
ncbi:hypothetical protein HQ529_05440 [Candidatus Woesearchaeota archaeon]|nr:hypothetical protein [Candidatus Woesearchaeota archaeon]